MFQHKELPTVFTNGAVSLDGKLALENRSLIQFSSARDRHFVFQLRATADAIFCGADTVETFSIDLGPGPRECKRKRQRLGLLPKPLRVLASEDGAISPKARIFKESDSPVIVLTTTTAARSCAKRLEGLATVAGFGKMNVDYGKAFRWLYSEWKVKSVLCEGGGETNAALIRAGVIDEIHVTLCPLILCGQEAPTLCDGKGFTNLKQATRLKLKEIKQVKSELFLTYAVLSRENQRRKK